MREGVVVNCSKKAQKDIVDQNFGLGSREEKEWKIDR